MLVCICNKKGLPPDPKLNLYNSPIKIVPETKCLGLLFNSKLTFLPHIKLFKNKCHKALNILQFVSNSDFGADSTVLLNLYTSLIRSKLDYGYIITVHPVYLISSCSIQFIKDYDSHLERSERLQLRFCIWYAVCNEIKVISFKSCIRLCC